MLEMSFTEVSMEILIEKIWLDENNVINIKPLGHTFEKIYRSAMGVYWNPDGQFLYHNISGDWDYLRWYDQIVLAVRSEYGVILAASRDTVFENIDESFKRKLGC